MMPNDTVKTGDLDSGQEISKLTSLLYHVFAPESNFSFGLTLTV